MVTGRGTELSDVAVSGGRITAMGSKLEVDADDVMDASGLHVFPGGIDSHVHFNDPGRTEWETIANGSAALAAGGYTAFVDMPLNNLPVTTDAGAFDAKLEAANQRSLLDFGLWGGLVPGNLDRLEEIASRGAMGFKAFMCPSGIDEFPACDLETLLEGMKRIAAMDSILLVHAEDPASIDAHPRGRGPRDFVRSRPPEAEHRAIEQATHIAGDTGCRLHVVHVSTARGVELVADARRQGVDVTCETCPHYLLYVEDDLERLGGRGKCAPPFRTAADRERLWGKLASGELPMVVSDHSPSTLDLKLNDDFLEIWGGISGCQSTRQLLLAQDRLPLSTIAAVTATNVAQRFRIDGKGDIAVGCDADLWLVDLGVEDVVRGQDLLYRNAFSAHEGRPIRGRTAHTILRGRRVPAKTGAGGRLIRPGPRS